MLDASDAHFGKYFPWLFGSQPIHLMLFASTSFGGNLIVNKTLASSDTDFLTRSDNTLIVFVRKFGLNKF